MAQQKIFGYANRISVRPGDNISFFVNCDGASEAQAQLVRLVHGDTHEAGPGHVEVELECPVNGRWAVPVMRQPIISPARNGTSVSPPKS